MQEQRKYRRLLKMAFCISIALVSFTVITPAKGWVSKAQQEWEGKLSELATDDISKSYSVDFDYLKLINEDVVGWLFQGESCLNRPIMQADNNSYYVRHTISREREEPGELFLGADNAPDFSDQVTYLYGSNLAQSGAFASFRQYFTEGYYAEHPCFRLLTPHGDYQLDVFAGYRTTQADARSWKVEPWSTPEQFGERIDQIVGKSTIEQLPEMMPEWEDRILTLVTRTKTGNEARYVLYARMRAIECSGDQSIDLNKYVMDHTETSNASFDIPSLGNVMVYAQNDPLWTTLAFESAVFEKRRPFGQGGCGPTAAAMVVANLVHMEDLPQILGYASAPTGYTFCTCSVNSLLCSYQHTQYHVDSPEEVLRYLPLVIADFACGNNIWGVQSRSHQSDSKGTDMQFLSYICKAYDLERVKTYDLDQALTALEQESTMVLGCALRGGPFTAGSHFVVMAGKDEEYLYILDPLRRDSYGELDKHGILDIMTPGVVRVKLEDAAKCQIYSYSIISNKNTKQCR